MQSELTPGGGHHGTWTSRPIFGTPGWLVVAMMGVVALAGCPEGDQSNRDADVGPVTDDGTGGIGGIGGDDGVGGIGGDDGVGGAGGDEGVGGTGGDGGMGGNGDCEPDGQCAEAGDPCTNAGQGICATEGVCVCEGEKLVCNAERIIPVPEACNGLDDDCDGTADEDPELLPCQVGVGVCALPGEPSCADGALQCAGEDDPGAATAETCNGDDDDCDGETDEDQMATPCTAGFGVCARQGMAPCVDGAPTCDVEPDAAAAGDEICDGLDNDCDGNTDEGLGGDACSAGFGPCAVEGETICRAGEIVCGAEPNLDAARAEWCNGIDDNCDGGVDLDGEVGICGRLAQERCEVWLGWSDEAFNDPGENYELDGLVDWITCPDTPTDHDGDSRCVGTAGLGVFRVLPLPVDGRFISNDDYLAISLTCDLIQPGDGQREIAFMNFVERNCQVSIAEAQTGGLPVVGPSWGPCPDAPRGQSPDGSSRCTTTEGRGLWWPIRLGGFFDERTDLGIRFACTPPSDDPADIAVARAVAQQAEVWLGWSRAGAEGVMDFGEWGACPAAIAPDGADVSCNGSGGTGCFHRVSIGDTTIDDAFVPGWLGIALRARAQIDPAVPPDGSVCEGAP